MPNYDLNQLGDEEFEHMVQALIKKIIGAGTITFGSGPDGGREATYSGKAPYPSSTEQWEGNWIFQVKFHNTNILGPDKARKEVLKDLKSELEKITSKYERRCDNYILATNVPLSSVHISGTHDKITLEIVPEFLEKIQHIHVWGYDDICRFLDADTKVRQTYGSLVTSGDIIASLIKKGKSVILPSIKSTLRKEETFEGDFFKREPEWIDFQEGYVIERKEVDQIIRKLENVKVQKVAGFPASGKSTILKNVGFKLTDKMSKYSVYILELKKIREEDAKLYFESILEMTDENSVFIVDDVHLVDCERFIRDFKSIGHGKLIIGRQKFKKHPKIMSEYEKMDTTYIYSDNDVTEKMIQNFLKRRYDFDDERIKIISNRLEEYKKDLWFLSWALMAYNQKNNSVSKEEIYDNICLSIRNMRIKNKETIKVEEVFLPLSMLSRFEIPIERNFLEEQMNIKCDILDQLIELNEIIETKEMMLLLHHSSVAELYFQTYMHKNLLGIKSKKIILNGEDKKYLEERLFYRYMMSADQINSVNIIIYLGRDIEDEKGGVTLLKKLVNHDEIQNLIKEGINEEENFYKIDRCLSIISNLNEEAAKKIVSNIDINILSSKISDSKFQSSKIIDVENAEFIPPIMRIVNINNSLFVVNINKDPNLGHLPKINNLEDINLILPAISFLVATIARIDESIALNDILVESITNRLEKISDILAIGLFIRCIDNINLVQKLIPTLISKIEKEKDINKVFLCIANIFYKNISNEITFEALLKLPQIFLRMDDAYMANIILDDKVDKDLGQTVGPIIIPILISRIEREEDTIKIWSFFAIYKNDNDLANKIYDHLNPQTKKLIERKKFESDLSRFSEVPGIYWSIGDEYSLDEYTLGELSLESIKKTIKMQSLGQHDEAIKSAKKAIKLNSDNYMVLLIVGGILDDLGQYDEALESTKKAIKLNSDDCMAWYNKGTILIHLERYKDAIQSLDKAIGLCPKYVCAWQNKLVALIKLGQKNDAISCLKDAIKICPTIKRKIKEDKDFEKILNDKDFEKILDYNH